MRISVIMPTLNEFANLAARAHDFDAQSDPWEWIVADGGSSDGTAARAAALGARVVTSAPGRGLQLDTGTRVASGEIVLFLHADTALPHGAFDAIRSLLGKAEIVGGNFALRFDERTTVARIFETIYRLRQRAFGTYFGDSAIFTRRAVYDAIGGFGEAPIMEDYAFSVAMREHGRVVRLPLAVITSARRYQRRPIRTLWTWISIMTLYRLGVAPGLLARFYRPNGP